MKTPFVRVKDRLTKHQYDVHIQAFDSEKHIRLTRFPMVAQPRPAKHHVKLSRDLQEETAAPE